MARPKLAIISIIRQELTATDAQALCGDTPTEASTLADTSLSLVYRDYIACLNRQDWAELKHFVHDEVDYNGERIG